MPFPQNLAELHTFMGMINYLNKFSPIITQTSESLTQVMKTDTLCMASLRGIGCVLMQDGKPVCYASRSLCDTESRYSNMESELLAACWPLERFTHYFFGEKVVVKTDHKPLESIRRKSIPGASPPLQRLLMRRAKYLQGKTNVIANPLRWAKKYRFF